MQPHMENLKITLFKNDYPEKVINLEINKFIKNRSKPTEDSSPDDTINQAITNDSSFEKEIQQIIQQEKQKRFIVLPYCNSKEDKFANRLIRLKK